MLKSNIKKQNITIKNNIKILIVNNFDLKFNIYFIIVNN